MAKTIIDTDYLFLASRVKALENSLLSRERMERMLEAPSPEEAAKVLQECGYPEMAQVSAQALEQVLAEQRQNVFDELYSAAPDPNMIDVFKVKYDYHNAKTILKAAARETDPAPLLMDAGRVSAARMAEAIRDSDLTELPTILQGAVQRSREVLDTTGDPQLADFVLDQAYFEDMFRLAGDSGSAFLQGYVEISVDAANLRSVVRTIRMGKSVDFLKGVLFEGGGVDVNRIIGAVTTGSSLEELYATSPLRDAAEAGQNALTGGPLTRFEKLTDDAVTGYLADAHNVAFGEAPVIAYLAAKESEFTAVRIILSGRMAGLDADIIRERLRESYV